MLIWAIFAAMAALAAAVVLRPLVIGRDAAVSRAVHEEAVYRDQLAELDRDVERGVVDAAEAAGARAEIARRLIAASERSGNPTDSAPVKSWRRPAALLVVVIVPVVALGVYLDLGSPDQPANRFADRPGQVIEQQGLSELVARVERHLQAEPTDAQGWEVIAPAYMRMRRFTDAADAWRRAISLGGTTARRLTGLGETLVLAAEGIVEVAARQAFEQATALDSRMAQPRYYLGLAAVQDRDYAKAIEIWQRLAADAPADAPWAKEVARQIDLAKARLSPDAGAGPGPSDEEIAAAAQMAESERREMIETMVAGLAAKLEADGSDLEGWVRLARSYIVLQRPDEARAALARAREAFAGRAAALERLDGAADALGL